VRDEYKKQTPPLTSVGRNDIANVVALKEQCLNASHRAILQAFDMSCPSAILRACPVLDTRSNGDLELFAAQKKKAQT
jgi:hypothetical protein